MAIVYPQYDHSILGLAASILTAFGASCAHHGLNELCEPLARDHKNTLVLILDGLGSESLAGILSPDSFLRSHQIADLSSVYPCTTTAATTTLMTGLSPAEHGWLGWSPWFREFGRVVDVFLDRDTFSGAAILPSPGKLLMPYRDAIDLISEAAGDSLTVHRLMPAFYPGGFGSLPAMAARIVEISQLPGRQLILAYWHEPDTLMHNLGPWSDAVRRDVQESDGLLGELIHSMDDTLAIITADHGQVEVEREIFLDEIPALFDCLVMPPSLETRAASLFVKAARREEFASRFHDLLGGSFLLMTHEDVFQRELFGPGRLHPKVDDFVGDFLACATGHDILRCHTPFNRPRTPFKGHHAGLRREEMIVPLIVVENIIA